MEWLIENISRPWIGSFIGVAGIILGIYFYLKTKIVSRLVFQYDGIALVGSSHSAFSDNITVSCFGVPVQRVTVERYAIWNAGNSTINGSQIVDIDRLRFAACQNVKILKAMIIKSTRQVNQFTLSSQDDGGDVFVNFDYVEPADGALIEILHSGKPGDVRIFGTVRGVRSGLEDLGQTYFCHEYTRNQNVAGVPMYMAMFRFDIILGSLVVLFGVLRPVLYHAFPDFFEGFRRVDYTQVSWFLIAFGGGFTLKAIAHVWKYSQKVPFSLGVRVRKGN